MYITENKKIGANYKTFSIELTKKNLINNLLEFFYVFGLLYVKTINGYHICVYNKSITRIKSCVPNCKYCNVY